MTIYFKTAGKNRWDIRVNGSKKGRVEKRRGSFVAVLTRHVPLATLDGIDGFVAELNAQR